MNFKQVAYYNTSHFKLYQKTTTKKYYLCKSNNQLDINDSI